MHYKLIREVFFLKDLYVMGQYRGHVVLNIQWRWRFLVRDIVRAVLLPVWVGVIVVIVGMLIVQDLVIFLCRICVDIVLAALWLKRQST